MKLILSSPLKALNGEPLKDKDGNAIILKNTLAEGLLADFVGEEQDKSEKTKRYLLATRIYNSEEIEITSEEAVLIKERINKACGALVYGQIDALLNG
jgi:hypothetical protein